jgi:hypothetical protein
VCSDDVTSSVQRHCPCPTFAFFTEEAISGLAQGDTAIDSFRASAGSCTNANRSNRTSAADISCLLQGQPAGLHGAVPPQSACQTYFSCLSYPHTTLQPDSRSGWRMDVRDKHPRISHGRPLPSRAHARAPRGTLRCSPRFPHFGAFGAFGAGTVALTSPCRHFTSQVKSLSGPRIN